MIIFSGMLTGARVAGVFFPLIVFLSVAVMYFSKQLSQKEIKMIFVYMLLYPVSVYVFFPTFWHDPVEEFFKAVAVMSRHPYEVTTFFMGETVHSLQTPWYYIVVWMVIIIPLGWWFFFLAGTTSLAIEIITKRRTIPIQWMIMITWLLLPIITAIALHSSTYDDGRHLFFIYPPFVLIAVQGFRSLLQNRIESLNRFFIPAASTLVFLITTIYIIVFMIRYHPYQYAYFNAIGRKYAMDYFEKDYWGLSYRNALEFLVKYVPEGNINVNWKVDPCEWNLIWLSDHDQERIHIVREQGEFDYYITNYRSERPVDASDKKIYEIKVQGITIMAVYKMN
jgi:hypothetical protein